MRGRIDHQQTMFVLFDLEQFVPADHPLRKIKRWVDEVLRAMSRDFDRAYSTASGAPTPPTAAGRIPRRVWRARGPARRRTCRTRRTC